MLMMIRLISEECSVLESINAEIDLMVLIFLKHNR